MGIEKKITTFRMDPDLYEEVRKLAEEQNRPVSNMIETIVKHYMEEYKKNNGQS